MYLPELLLGAGYPLGIAVSKTKPLATKWIQWVLGRIFHLGMGALIWGFPSGAGGKELRLPVQDT